MSIWFLLFHLLFRCVDLPRLLLMYPRLHYDFMFWLTEALCAFVMNTPFQFNFSFLKAPRDYLISINCNEIILFSSSRFPHTVQRLCFYAYLIDEDSINLSLVTGTRPVLQHLEHCVCRCCKLRVGWDLYLEATDLYQAAAGRT